MQKNEYFHKFDPKQVTGSTPRSLEKLAKAVEDHNIEWFEEPIYGNDARLLHDLRMRTSVPISAGQNEGHRFRYRELLVNSAVDILQPNVVYCGGYTEGVKVAAMAQAGSEFIIKFSAAGSSPLSMTIPETLPAVAGSNAGAAGAATGVSPLSPPPQATADASTSMERTVHKFRCCIENLLRFFTGR